MESYLNLRQYLEKSNQKESEKAFISTSLEKSDWFPINELTDKEYIGKGSFGQVFKYNWNGSPVAVKILGKGIRPQREINVLKSLKHTCVIRFLGVAQIDKQYALITEYISSNLDNYIKVKKSLNIVEAWEISQKIASGLNYLHSNNITHRDLKTDNILIELNNPDQVKICDFGVAFNSLEDQVTGESKFYFLWMPPEVIEYRIDPSSDEDWKCVDVYTFGLVMGFMVLGSFPKDVHINFKDFPEEYHSFFNLITQCKDPNPKNRPTMNHLINTYFKSTINPYALTNQERKPFFSCGSINAQVFVFERSNECNTKSYFGCEDIATEFFSDEYNFMEELENKNLKEKYLENFQKWEKKAQNGEIDNNKMFALKAAFPIRQGDEETQRLKLVFQVGHYVHHKAMGDIWKIRSEREKYNLLHGDLHSVHPLFSNSFGVQIAVITSDKKFIFPKRSGKTSQSNFMYVCGAVEGMNTTDINEQGKPDPFLTATRGLKEELHIIVNKEDIKFLSLIFKFDTHEWGLTGVVDLSDISTSNSYLFTSKCIEEQFNNGFAKDKFENSSLVFVPFQLDQMHSFVQKNWRNFASSSIATVFHVMYYYFTKEAVQKQFAEDSSQTSINTISLLHSQDLPTPSSSSSTNYVPLNERNKKRRYNQLECNNFSSEKKLKLSSSQNELEYKSIHITFKNYEKNILLTPELKVVDVLQQLPLKRSNSVHYDLATLEDICLPVDALFSSITDQIDSYEFKVIATSIWN